MKVLVINGPNLNMLGIREPEVYGKDNYQSLIDLCKNEAALLGIDEIEIFQSNHEGEIVDRIQQAFFDHVNGIVINPAGYTHTSIAILDALQAVNIPCVEVHISNVNHRETFRQTSYIRSVCIDSIYGKGIEGYKYALRRLCEHADKPINLN